MKTTTLISNILLFQLGWFACVLGAALDMAVIGSIVGMSIIALHLWRVAHMQPELILLALAAVTGAAFDSLLFTLGWLDFSTGVLLPGMAPYWMIILWMLFASTLNISLRWFKSRLFLAGLFGAICGPIAYYGGAKLGALSFGDMRNALIALAIGWGLLFPLLLAFSRRFNGVLTDTSQKLDYAPGGQHV